MASLRPFCLSVMIEMVESVLEPQCSTKKSTGLFMLGNDSDPADLEHVCTLAVVCVKRHLLCSSTGTRSLMTAVVK